MAKNKTINMKFIKCKLLCCNSMDTNLTGYKYFLSVDEMETFFKQNKSLYKLLSWETVNIDGFIYNGMFVNKNYNYIYMF